MRSIKIRLLVLSGCLLMVPPTLAQSDKEKEKKMMDSIMAQIPADQRKMVEQMMKMGQQADQQREAKRAEADKKLQEKKAEQQKAASDDFYWRDRQMASSSNKFSNWSYGPSEIRAMVYVYETRSYESVPMGTISGDGQINFQLPAGAFIHLARTPVTKNASEGEGIFSKELTYGDPYAKYFSTRFTLGVYQGEKRVGMLAMGNDVKPVVNLNAPCCSLKSGDGYMVYWVYFDKSVQVNGTRTYNMMDSDVLGTAKIQLDFKEGWNMIKVAVKGSARIPSGYDVWTDKRITSLGQMPGDARYFFTTY